MTKEDEIRERFTKAGQQHVFEHFEACDDASKAKLLQQLDSIAVDKLATFLKAAQEEQKSISAAANIEPFQGQVARSSDKDVADKARAAGLEAIGKGQVAALVLAGGQGSRLGFDGPKGKYDIGMPSGKALFQLTAERIDKLRQLAATGDDKPTLPFYIMTSPINHDETVKFFDDNDCFGLPKDDVKCFAQGMLPCLTPEGKIIMKGKDEVAMAPDGNGGIYPAMQSSGTMDDMEKRGVQFIHVFSIDNALTKPADPVFVGYCVAEKADCGNKSVWKASAHEKVGVVASKDGKPCIVEYSDISKEMVEQTEKDSDRLVYGAGNICNHYYTLDFLKDTVIPNTDNMYHIANKKIPYYDAATGTTVKPTSNNGIKLESFIFDVFPLSKSMVVLDVLREEEFAPVKNPPGSSSDSPDTARALLSDLGKRWVKDAGGELTGDVDAICEVSPSTSYGGEGMEDLVKDKKIECPFHIDKGSISSVTKKKLEGAEDDGPDSKKARTE